MLSLTFVENTKGAPVGDLHLGERRLLATTHPATIVAAMFAMELTELKVATSVGSHVGELEFLDSDAEFPSLPALKIRMSLNPRLYQFRHLATSEDYVLLLEGLDLFAHENWYEPTALADEHSARRTSPPPERRHQAALEQQQNAISRF